MVSYNTVNEVISMFNKYLKLFPKLGLIEPNSIFSSIELNPILLNKITKNISCRLRKKKDRYTLLHRIMLHPAQFEGVRKELCCKIKINCIYKAILLPG